MLSQSNFLAKQVVIDLKSKNDLANLRVAAKAVASVLKKLSENIKPGISTKDLDDIAFKEIKAFGMKPAFLGYRGYPATACISINNELVHGIPSSKRLLAKGDIVSIDLGTIYNGFYGDAAITVPVGKISSQAQKLLEVGSSALEHAIENVKLGNRLGDVCAAIQTVIEKNGFSVVRDYVGHGIGRALHEEPAIPNFGRAGSGPRLLPGMVLAIEPMLNMGDWRVKTLNDGWTVVTQDGSLCAHFEHTVALTEDGCEVLTRI